MRFGVVVCPRCKQVKGVDLRQKTTRCVGCGKVLVLGSLIIFYETDSQQQLRHAIGLLNEQLAEKQTKSTGTPRP